MKSLTISGQVTEADGRPGDTIGPVSCTDGDSAVTALIQITQDICSDLDVSAKEVSQAVADALQKEPPKS